LYALFITVDGNFKLKGKEWNLKDVELMPRWGAYVPQDKYQEHIANYVDEPEVSNSAIYLNGFLTDQHLRISTRRSRSRQYSVNSRICCVRRRFCHLFQTLPDTQKWSWGSQEG
jgi:hypothetical protein